MGRVKQMVKDTGIVVEIDDPTEKAAFEKQRKRKLFTLFGK